MKKYYKNRTKDVGHILKSASEVNDFRERQNKIMTNYQSTTLSTENSQLLQRKLDTIAMELYKDRRSSLSSRKTKSSFTCRSLKSTLASSTLDFDSNDMHK